MIWGGKSADEAVCPEVANRTAFAVPVGHFPGASGGVLERGNGLLEAPRLAQRHAEVVERVTLLLAGHPSQRVAARLIPADIGGQLDRGHQVSALAVQPNNFADP